MYCLSYIPSCPLKEPSLPLIYVKLNFLSTIFLEFSLSLKHRREKRWVNTNQKIRYATVDIYMQIHVLGFSNYYFLRLGVFFAP